MTEPSQNNIDNTDNTANTAGAANGADTDNSANTESDALTHEVSAETVEQAQAAKPASPHEQAASWSSTNSAQPWSTAYDEAPAPNKRPTWVRGAAFGAAGLLAAVIAGTLVANASSDDASAAVSSVDPDTTATAPTAPGQDDRAGGPPVDGRGPGAGEEALTGDTATKVEAAVLAEYPGATIDRLETDSEGVYEAHIVTAEGERVHVMLDADFAITGEGIGGPGGGRGGGPGGHGEAAPDGSDEDSTEDGTTDDSSATRSSLSAT